VLKASFAAATLIALGVPGIAHAATSSPQIHLLKAPANRVRVMRIAAPADGTLIKSRSIPVRVNVTSQVSRVKVFAGTKNVSGRFSRHGSAFTARLPRSLFKTGTNRLLVQTKLRGGKSSAAASVSFIVPRTNNAMMNMATGAHIASVLSSSPLADPGYLPSTPGQIPVAIHTKTATFARLTVNGHRVSDIRANRPLADHHWLVSAGDGLKAGRNRFVVESWDKQGNHSVKRWTVQRSRSRPLTDAGPRERVVKPSTWTTVDGSKTKATKKGAKLSYAWRIVKAPKGAKPKLRNATSATPQFKPDTPGVYQLALRATQAKPGVASAAAANQGSEDVTTLDAVPALGAQGLFASTALNGQAMNIEGQSYGTSTDNTADTFVQLDETTLAVLASGTHDDITPAAGTITIGTWMNTSVGSISSDQYGSAIWIGTKEVGYISTPTSPGTNVGNPTSYLQGWIEPASSDSADDATWVDSDMVQAKTRLTTDTATTNTIEVNGQQNHQTLPAGATGGWQLVMLDHQGKPFVNNIYAADATGEDTLSNNLKGIGWGYTWIIQAFGNVPALQPSSNLAQTLQQFGGRADVVDRFNGKTDSTGGVYSLISGGSSKSANSWSPGFKATEASYERTGTTGTQTALLIRDADGNDYVPFNTDSAAPDPAGSNRYSFLPMVYAPPSNWTAWVRNTDGTRSAPTAAQTAAFDDLLGDVTKMNWVPKTPLCPNAPDAIRGDYCNTNATQLQTLLSRVSSLSFDADTAGSRYTSADWTKAQNSIEWEIGDVSNIRSAIADYENLFGTVGTTGVVDASTIGDSVKSAINTAATVPSDANLAAILSGLTDMASVIPEVAAPMTFVSGLFGMESALEPNTSPQPLLDQVQVTQDNAGATLLSALQQASTQLSTYGDMSVEDPAKLQQAGAFFMNNDPETTNTNSSFVHAAEYATEQWLWGSELATAYTVWTAPSTVSANPYCTNKGGTSGGHPFANLSGTTGSFPSLASDWSATNWILGYDNQAKGGWGWAVPNNDWLNETGLPSAVTNAMFGQPINANQAPTPTTNAGAVMPYFALDYLPFKPLPIAPQAQWHGAPAPIGCQPF
jgi:hypothetical protein